jgi:hemerythrin superfamily protein
MTRMDTILSKSAGKMKGFRARLGGMVGVFQMLVEQHGRLAVLMHRLQEHPDERDQRWPEIRRELLAHERSEIRELYPMMRSHPDLAHLADDHDDEAAELERIVEELDELRHPVAWRALYDELVTQVLAHAREEEQRIFPTAQQGLGAQCARDLEPRLLAVQRTVQSAV